MHIERWSYDSNAVAHCGTPNYRPFLTFYKTSPSPHSTLHPSPHPFPDKPIFFVLQNLCCLSVIKDFTKLKKYNLQSLAAPEAEKTDNLASSSNSSSSIVETAVKPKDSSSHCQKVEAIHSRTSSMHSESSAKVGEAQTEAQKADS